MAHMDYDEALQCIITAWGHDVQESLEVESPLPQALSSEKALGKEGGWLQGACRKPLQCCGPELMVPPTPRIIII